MTFGQRERQAQERLARHGAKVQAWVERLTEAERVAFEQRKAEARQALLRTTSK
jgi:hypothetical protein